jgi:hypothetical protein
LRARAKNCHRLAAGAGHPEFALKLSALAKEYEAKAIRADTACRLPALRKFQAEILPIPQQTPGRVELKKKAVTPR